MQHSIMYTSPVGQLEIRTNDSAITEILYPNQQTSEAHTIESNLPIFDEITTWLDNYFSGNQPDVNFPLEANGTEFQHAVWEELKQIPYGETTTYGDIAQRVARKLGKNQISAQAVGGAVGSNPLSIIVPCHRVVGKDGSLTGYVGTIDNKIKLLEHEHVDMTHLYRPKMSTKP